MNAHQRRVLRRGTQALLVDRILRQNKGKAGFVGVVRGLPGTGIGALFVVTSDKRP